MIRRIRGEIAEIGPEHVLLGVGNIYYEVFVAPATAERLMERPIGSEIELHTFHYLQDDQARSVPILMGFETQLQREFFERLIDAPRFGPRGALRSMTIPLTTYAKAIEIGDTKLLKSLPGIGASTAKALVAQLQGKLGRFIGAEDLAPAPGVKRAQIESDIEAEAIEVLKQLGVQESDAVRSVLGLRESGEQFEQVEDIVKAVLKR